MKRIDIFYVKACCAGALLLLAYACSELEKGIPTGDETAPLQVVNVVVNRIPGGAVLNYQLPPNSNILYVMAEYTLADGVVHNKKSSHFNPSITLEGFPDTVAYAVKLYSVSRSGVRSEPVPVSIVPLEPPYWSAFQSLQITPTFEGTKIAYENVPGANMKFVVLTTDSIGKFYEADIHYTQLGDGVFSVRNPAFGKEQRLFGVYTIDRWNNCSDTLFAIITPMVDTLLDRTRFVNAKLASDTWQNHMSASYAIETAWNGVWDSGLAFHTIPNSGIPQWFTIDLKVKAQLSRMKFYHRKSSGTDGQYNAGDVQIFEIYGSNTPVDEWTDDWVLLGHFESIKPSGSAAGVYTDEDVQYACVNGEEFEFENSSDAFRYLRFKTLKTWGGLTYMFIAELSFWGNIVETY